jgi:hypothetical protein
MITLPYILFIGIAVVLLVIVLILLMTPTSQPTTAPRRLNNVSTSIECSSSKPCYGTNPYCVDYKCINKQGNQGQNCLYDSDCVQGLTCNQNMCVIDKVEDILNDGNESNVVINNAVSGDPSIPLGNATRIKVMEQARRKSNDEVIIPNEKPPIYHLGVKPKSKDWYIHKKKNNKK